MITDMGLAFLVGYLVYAFASARVSLEMRTFLAKKIQFELFVYLINCPICLSFWATVICAPFISYHGIFLFFCTLFSIMLSKLDI